MRELTELMVHMCGREGHEPAADAGPASGGGPVSADKWGR